MNSSNFSILKQSTLQAILDSRNHWVTFFTIFCLSLGSFHSFRFWNRVHNNWYQRFCSKIRFCFSLFCLFSFLISSSVFSLSLHSILRTMHIKNHTKHIQELVTAPKLIVYFLGSNPLCLHKKMKFNKNKE